MSLIPSPPWLDSPHRPFLEELFASFLQTFGPDRLFFVGGLVRDWVMGFPCRWDIDLATPVHPFEVLSWARERHIPFSCPGYVFGTVNLHGPEGLEIQITTFRKDVKCDGRRAKVRYGKSLEEDARRRDFTINALYATWEGEILDPTGGLADIKKQRLRFIGNPEQRIREDYLRILRLFRFSATLGWDIDKGLLPLIKRQARGLQLLSSNRQWNELSRILAVTNPWPTLAKMRPLFSFLSTPLVLPEDIRRIQDLEKTLGNQGIIIRLGSLLPNADISFPLRAGEVKFLSKLLALRKKPLRFDPLIWDDLGEEFYKGLLFLQSLHTSAKVERHLKNVLREMEETPSFPLVPGDLITWGLEPGPQISYLFNCLREDWARHPKTWRTESAKQAMMGSSACIPLRLVLGEGET